MAPVVKTLKNDAGFKVKVLVTGQHREMLDQVLTLFEIVPDYDLDIMTKGQSLTDITQKALAGLDEILMLEKPDVVLVHGDTTTAFVGALAAFYNKVKIGHVEAGLRTYKKTEPFPEEINRRLVSQMADFHFAPTAAAKGNLVLEGFEATNIFVTGNTVIDALFDVVDENHRFKDPALKRIDFTKKIVLAEIHRRENLDHLEGIFAAFKEIAARFESVEIVYSVHPNPTVRRAAADFLSKDRRIHLINPPPYKEWVNLMKRSFLLITDSGGLQEEAPSLDLPVLVVRDVTERPEALKARAVRLVGNDPRKIVEAAADLLQNNESYQAMTKVKNPYGDGFASKRVKKALRSSFTGGEKPSDYVAN